MSEPRLEGIEACVFDAYGTLFDVNAAAAHCAEEIGEKWQALADLWRTRQLQYSWLRALQGQYVEFWQVTGDALDFAMESCELQDPDLRRRLMELYLALDAYEEVPEMLARLKDGGMKTAILTNGSPDMVNAAVKNAGIADLLDAVLSVDSLKTYKTSPAVYQMAVDALGVPAHRISFQSSNAWDAHAGSAFGYKVCWINRFGQRRERLPGSPDVELRSLHDLPQVVLGTQIA